MVQTTGQYFGAAGWSLRQSGGPRAICLQRVRLPASACAGPLRRKL